MGAKIVGRVPDVGGGAFGAAHLAHIYQQRMAEVRAEELARGLAIRAETMHKLAEMAKKASTPERPVTPMEMAIQIVEEAVANYREAS